MPKQTMFMQKPNLYIIAGCNGAAFNVLHQIPNCREFVNTDEIALVETRTVSIFPAARMEFTGILT